MNIEQRIKELEETNQKLYEAAEFVDKQNDELLKVSKELQKEHKRIIKINKDLQSEVERYKSLWEANAAESEEIIAELKEALTFYADKKHIGKDCHHYPVIKDDGKVARNILKPNSSE